jgi:hypothetical protein
MCHVGFHDGKQSVEPSMQGAGWMHGPGGAGGAVGGGAHFVLL